MFPPPTLSLGGSVPDTLAEIAQEKKILFEKTNDMNMKIKTSRWTLLAAILFTINTIYWYLNHPEDAVGIIIYLIASIIFYIATIGNWKSGN